MKLHHKKVLTVLVNGVIGYFVIHCFVSSAKIVRSGKTSPVHDDNSSHQEVSRELEAIKQNNESQYDEEWFATMEARQRERRAKLRKVCRSLYDRDVRTPQELASDRKRLRALIVNERHRFVYSIVYKVGSTNWERVIVEDLEGHRGVPNQALYAHGALRWMPTFDEEAALRFLERYTKFIFVRNPLARILSGYRDKFVEHQNSVFTGLARRIIKHYRTGSDGESGGDSAHTNPNITFAEFVAYLVDSAENRGNPHWKPVYVQNMPCEVDFDIIGKLEDAVDDIPFVLKRIGIWNVTDYGKGPPRKNTDNELIKQYYSEIPPKLLQQLYNVYEPDFHMFGYEMPLYL